MPYGSRRHSAAAAGIFLEGNCFPHLRLVCAGAIIPGYILNCKGCSGCKKVYISDSNTKITEFTNRYKTDISGCDSNRLYEPLLFDNIIKHKSL